MAPPNPRMLNFKRLIKNINHETSENEDYLSETENLPKISVEKKLRKDNPNPLHKYPLKLRSSSTTNFENKLQSRTSSHSSLNSQRSGDFSPASDNDIEYKPDLSESSEFESEETSCLKKMKKLRKINNICSRSLSGSYKFGSSAARLSSSGSSASSSSASGSSSSANSSSDSDSDEDSPASAKCSQNSVPDDFAIKSKIIESSPFIDIAADLTMTSSEEGDEADKTDDLLRPQSTQSLENRNQIAMVPSLLCGNDENQLMDTATCDLEPLVIKSPLSLKEIAFCNLNRVLNLESVVPAVENISISNTSKKRRRGNKKEIAKTLRNLGLAYTSASTSRKLVSPRKLKEPCNSRCRLKCSERISQESRQTIFEDYWNMGSLTRQRDFIAKQISEVKPKYQYKRLDNNRLPKHAFYLTVNRERQRVCKIFFKNTLGINDRPIRTVIQKQNASGILEPERRGKHENHGTKTSEELLVGVRNYIHKIPRIESHYLRKQTTREYIDGGKNVADLYNDYKNECLGKNLDYVKIHTFRKIFNEDFNISFFTPKKDQCDLCTSFKNADQTEKRSLEEQYQRHLQEKEKSREEKSRDKEEINSNKIVACYDLQAVLPVPRGDVSVFYYKSKLNCFNFTISELGTGNTECYFWSEVEGQRGACEIGTCVYKYILKKTSAAATSEPIELIFYSDNCCGQQKNQYIISLYLYALNEIHNLKSITHKFLIKGHTQNEGDAVHSTIEKRIKKALRSGPIYVPDQYVQIIREAKKKGNKFIVNEMSYSEFFNIKCLAQYKFNKNADGEIVKIGDIKVIKIEKTEENDDANKIKVFYKTSYIQDEFKEIKLQKQRHNVRNVRTQNSRSRLQIKRLYHTKLQLSERKKDDLRSLVQSKHIPKYYASSFYDNIINH
ncbi:unnamed protein product [Euphydryas editha]|uniref:DUF7869 domain-containing protein n=1 Tax=Euphydryas editha TaxID=104508 RepID=A0AAU9UVB4_EUPED|nr:unnamed protein product [Euphydryas editha]